MFMPFIFHYYITLSFSHFKIYIMGHCTIYIFNFGRFTKNKKFPASIHHVMYREVNLCRLEMEYFLMIELAHYVYDDDDGDALGEKYVPHLWFWSKT